MSTSIGREQDRRSLCGMYGGDGGQWRERDDGVMGRVMYVLRVRWVDGRGNGRG